jgi:triacylglycerol lipase
MTRLLKFTPSHLVLLLSALTLLVSPALCRADNTIDFTNIQRHAQLSSAVYQPIDALEASLPPGFTLIAYQTVLELEIACLVVIDDASGDLVLAVRGTSNISNALTDIDFKLTPDPIAGIKLHNGFAEASRAIYRLIEPLLDRGRTVNTTGHSLGGAVALIMAMYLHRDDFRVGDVITFGQPKVTNIAGSDEFKHLAVTRVVTPLDIVPMVPLFDPLDIGNLDIFWHLGREVVLHDDSRYSILSGVNSMMRAVKFTQRLIDQQNLDQHRMSLYHSLVENKTDAAAEVPFKTDLNLFNLFGKPNP